MITKTFMGLQEGGERMKTEKDDEKVRKLIESKKVVNDAFLKRLVGGLRRKYYERQSEERVWKVHGKKKSLIVYDLGNGWYEIAKLVR